jgi:sarcosine oxidase
LACAAGADVLAIEQFELGHSRGESQDHCASSASHHTPGYVELAKRATCWAQVEEDGKERCVLKTGDLDLAPAGAAIPRHLSLEHAVGRSSKT